MKQSENVTKFTKRFWTICSQIKDANDELAVMCFKVALLPRNDLRREIVRYPMTTMKALMARVNQLVEQEEDEVRAQENFGMKHGDKPSAKDQKPFHRKETDQSKAHSRSMMISTPASGNKKKSQQSANSYRAVSTFFKEPIYKLLNKIKMEPFFKWPQPMRGDPSTRDQGKYCTYYKQNGHKTEDCMSLKSHLERLVKDVHPKDYVKKERTNRVQRGRQDDKQNGNEPEVIINVIHLAPESKESGQSRTQTRMASHAKQVMTAELDPAVKRARKEKPKIWFSDEDLEGVQLPHNDPLLLTLRLKNFLVRWVLVDPGSSSEILYYNCFKK